MEEKYIDRNFILTIMDIVEKISGENITIEKMRKILMVVPQDGHIWFEIKEKEASNNCNFGNHNQNIRTFTSVKEAFDSFAPEQEKNTMNVHIDANNMQHCISYEKLKALLDD